MSTEGHRIFEVLALPAPERVLRVAEGCFISIGDFGWENDTSTEFIHLTGYSPTGGTVWYANFRPSEVRFAALKPPIGTIPSITCYTTKAAVTPPPPTNPLES